MSGSPKTMNRLPEPVFFSSSSPIARSGFIRAWRIVSRPSVEASSPASGSNAKPHTTSRSAKLIVDDLVRLLAFWATERIHRELAAELLRASDRDEKLGRAPSRVNLARDLAVGRRREMLRR